MPYSFLRQRIVRLLVPRLALHERITAARGPQHAPSC